MKALKCFAIPVILVSGLFSQVYAAAPENGFYSFFKTIYYLIMFALILAAAYYATKFLAKRGMTQNKSKTMKLMETMPIGPDKSVHLIKVGTQYFLLGSASKNMYMISEIDKDKLYEEQHADIINAEGFDYDTYENVLEAKEFNLSLNSMKDNLKKLKSIVRGNNRDEI